MIANIESYNINDGVAQSLISKLIAVQDALDADRAACNQLNAIVNEINAQDGKKLTAQQAASLRKAAAALSTSLGC